MKNEKTKKGFTIIEVMLVLAISGLLLIGTLGGTYSAVRTQRYNDAVNTFAENLRQVYNEVLNPRSQDDQSGSSLKQAIYGKVIQFGGNMPGDGADFGRFFSATLVGDVDLAEIDAGSTNGGFLPSLIDQNVTIACDTVTSRPILWEAQAYKPGAGSADSVGFTGMVIIARHPRTGAVHTIVADGRNYDFYSGSSDCSVVQAGFKAFLSKAGDDGDFKIDQGVTFCIKSDEASIIRGVSLAADGTNSSAVSILTEVESREAGCK